MPKKRILLVEEENLITGLSIKDRESGPDAGTWVLLLRNFLRMPQAELAARAGITQSHLTAIESGKIDPQITTLRKVFQGLSCDLALIPQPQMPLKNVLRLRAQEIARKRLRHSMGTMALEGQAPTSPFFNKLLKKETERILRDPKERLWEKPGD